MKLKKGQTNKNKLKGKRIMKSSKEFMDNFMENWKNMIKYQDVKLNPIEPNYDEFERAFNEEKKIVSTQECRESRKMIEIDDERQKEGC